MEKNHGCKSEEAPEMFDADHNKQLLRAITDDLRLPEAELWEFMYQGKETDGGYEDLAGVERNSVALKEVAAPKKNKINKHKVQTGEVCLGHTGV